MQTLISVDRHDKQLGPQCTQTPLIEVVPLGQLVIQLVSFKLNPGRQVRQVVLLLQVSQFSGQLSQVFVFEFSKYLRGQVSLHLLFNKKYP
jgi:hypothetical protein